MVGRRRRRLRHRRTHGQRTVSNQPECPWSRAVIPAVFYDSRAADTMTTVACHHCGRQVYVRGSRYSKHRLRRTTPRRNP